MSRKECASSSSAPLLLEISQNLGLRLSVKSLRKPRVLVVENQRVEGEPQKGPFPQVCFIHWRCSFTGKREQWSKQRSRVNEIPDIRTHHAARLRRLSNSCDTLATVGPSWKCTHSSSSASTPPPGLGLATEPTLPLRSVESRPRVRLPARHVVDARPTPADIPLDAALAGIVPSSALKPLSAPPARRHHEVAPPHAAPGRLRRGLLRHVVARVLRVHHRPPLRDHPRVQVLAGEAAHGDDAPVTIAVPLLTRGRPARHSRSARVAAAPQRHVFPPAWQVCLDSGASMPWNRCAQRQS